MIKFDIDLRQVLVFYRDSWFPPPIKLTTWYNGNIVESDVKHHNPIPFILRLMVFNDIFNNISFIFWQKILFVGETGSLWERHPNLSFFLLGPSKLQFWKKSDIQNVFIISLPRVLTKWTFILYNILTWPPSFALLTNERVIHSV